MTERITTAHLLPRALLLESDDLLETPHAAQQLQDRDLTYSDYVKHLTGDLARGLSRADWTRQIASEGDIALARRLAASCGSPDLDRLVESQRQDWLKQCQNQLEQSQQALEKTTLPLSAEDEQRVHQLREGAIAQMREERFHLARGAIQQLTGEITQMLQYATQLQQERRDQAITHVRKRSERYYAIALSHDTSKISEHVDKLLYM